MERKITFGKYKGQDIKYIMLAHIGYIMWCLENLKWFHLNDEEQALYDALAIMIKKQNLEMTFPTETLYKHIKDKEKFEHLITPFTYTGNYTSVFGKDIDNPIAKSVMKYKINSKSKNIARPTIKELSGLMHSINKEIEIAEANNETDEDIFGGWSNDYKDA